MVLTLFSMKKTEKKELPILCVPSATSEESRNLLKFNLLKVSLSDQQVRKRIDEKKPLLERVFPSLF